MSRDQIQSLKEQIATEVIELGLVKAEIFDKTSKHAKNTGESTFDLLIKDGDLTIKGLLKSLSDKYNIPFELNPQPLVPKINKFPVRFCLSNAVVPIAEESDTIEFGLCHPGSLNALKNLSLMIGKKIKASFIPPDFIFQSILQKHIHTISEVKKSDLKKIIKANKNVPIPDI